MDSRRNRVHYLNHTATFVLSMCTGERDADEIARALQHSFELSEPPEQDVRNCLKVLRAERLVASGNGPG
jgi:hypothetical protein